MKTKFIVIFIGVCLTFFSIAYSVETNRDNPGDLIDYEFLDYMTADEIFDYLDDFLPFPPYGYGVSIYKLVYETVDGDGEPTIASGALAIPEVESLHLPFLSFQHGTVLERDDVASVTGFDGFYGLIGMWMGTSGYVTAIPDYLGLGVSEIFHPYIIAEPSATSIIDMMRASREFCAIQEINLNGQVFLGGYSEGGYTTMAAQKMIEEDYPDEFYLTASAPCSGPYDLSGVMVDVMLSGEEYGQPWYLPYTVLAYQDAYNLVDDLNDYLLPFYADTLPLLFDGTHSTNEVDAIMPTVPIEIFHPEVIEEFANDPNHPLRLALAENDLIDWAPQSLTTLYHSDDDELVPVENSENAFIHFILNGSPQLDFQHGPLGSHSDAAGIILLAVANWFSQLMHIGIPGDLNEDLEVNILDITIGVNIILEINDPTSHQQWAGDLNTDETIDIFDIILLVNFILDS